MTREEEIELAASCHIAASNEDFKEYYEGFIAGAKWADNNPKEGLVSIDKVREWLENNVNNYIIIDDYLGKVQPKISSIMFDDFKKAMES